MTLYQFSFAQPTYVRLVCVQILWLLSDPTALRADDPPSELKQFVSSFCLSCHDAGTETSLDFTTLESHFENPSDFATWVHVFDRIREGEMPPADAEQPSSVDRQLALQSLKTELLRTNAALQRKVGRVPSRRLTRFEYQNTLQDLLRIDANVAKLLPIQNRVAGSFDVLAANQEMSSVYVRSLLQAADAALEDAIQLGPAPERRPRELNYRDSPYIEMWLQRPVRRGGGTIFRTDRDLITFRGENYVLRSDHNGFRIPVAGRYKITITAAAYQPRSAVTVSLKRQNDLQGESELFAAWDVGKKYRQVSATKYLRPDDYIYVSADELEPSPDGKVIYNSQPASEFGGEGVAIRQVLIEGPLEDDWPPTRTSNLLQGLHWSQPHDGKRGSYVPEFTKTGHGHARAIVKRFGESAFRRPLTEDEINHLISLAGPGIANEQEFVEAIRVPLRAILVSPELLFLAGPPGPLEGNALASRLSYFLWRSLPDDELLQLADSNRLSEPTILHRQVERMLDDPKFDRFVHDFLDQWLDLGRIDATTPDAYLYPEYDDVLRAAMLAETRLFVAHLIQQDLGAEHLIDSDFTFLNRRLAEHYGMHEIKGEAMRLVALPDDSVRGGILSHASIAKVTANGTVTTPVRRGNFVLSNLLGTPPKPPPPNVGVLEPDTRGATTIRQTLEKHQADATCASCHQRIDPPGFAMECFDPVGIFRTRYRRSRGVSRTASVGLRFLHKDYDLAQAVDPSGTTANDESFRDFREYKSLLLKSREQVARNLLYQLVAFSTGAEVQFADRDELERILQETAAENYPVRTLIHKLVGSRIFLHR